MTSFFKQCFPFGKHKQRKKSLYSELCFSHKEIPKSLLPKLNPFTARYNDLAEFSTHFISIPCKFIICFYKSLLEFLLSLLYLFASILYLATNNKNRRNHYFIASMNSISNSIYLLASCAVDPFLALITFIPRTIVSSPHALQCIIKTVFTPCIDKEDLSCDFVVTPKDLSLDYAEDEFFYQEIQTLSKRYFCYDKGYLFYFDGKKFEEIPCSQEQLVNIINLIGHAVNFNDYCDESIKSHYKYLNATIKNRVKKLSKDEVLKISSIVGKMHYSLYEHNKINSSLNAPCL